MLVEQDDSGNQHVRVQTNLAGKLILHWGVEGGANYEEGWRLPGDSSRPDGTVEYKKRALQTPFRCPSETEQLCLPADWHLKWPLCTALQTKKPSNLMQQLMAAQVSRWFGTTAGLTAACRQSVLPSKTRRLQTTSTLSSRTLQQTSGQCLHPRSNAQACGGLISPCSATGTTRRAATSTSPCTGTWP